MSGGGDIILLIIAVIALYYLLTNCFNNTNEGFTTRPVIKYCQCTKWSNGICSKHWCRHK
jgi:hypothetical protein